MKNTTAVLLTILVGALALGPIHSHAADGAIAVETVMDNTRIPTNGTAYGKVISVENQRLAGNFGLQMAVSGTTGTIQRVDVQVSNDGAYFAIPDGFGPIDTAVSTGTNFYAVTVPLARYVRLRVITTNDGANVTARLAYQ